MTATCRRPARALRAAAAVLAAVLASPTALALPPEIPPHQLVRQQWTVADGLPQTTVVDLAQDPSGYLWLATQDGLARFDGFEFRSYRLRDHPALNHNYINALAAEPDGTVWVGSTLGLARSRDDGFESLTADGDPTGAVHALLPAVDGGVWVGAENGLFLASQEDGLQPLAGAAPQGRVAALAHTVDGRLAAALGDHLLVVDAAGATRELHLPGFRGLRSLVAGAAGSDVWLWVGGDQGLVGIDDDGRVVRRPLRRHDVEALLLDRDGAIWIGTDSGLWRMPAGEQPLRAEIPELGQRVWIRSLLEDREGNVWVGSHTGGVFQLQAGVFRRIGATDGLTDGIVWSLYADPAGGVWAGTADGAFHGDLEGFRQPIATSSLPHPMVLAFLRDSDGVLWIGTRQGLARLKPGAARAEPVAGVESMIYNLLEDREGRLWIGSRSGVQRIVDGTVETLGPDSGLPTATARSILQASDGRIWIGTDLGAYRQDGPGFAAVGVAEGLDSRHVHMLRETRPGEIMMALQGGIARSTLGGDSVVVFDESDGLHAGMVMLLQPTADQRLWYNTHEGIGMLPFEQIDRLLAGSIKQLQPRVFGRLDQPQVAQCNGGHGNAGMLSNDRWLWCPSLEGALVLDTHAIDAPTSLPLPVLQQLTAGGRTHPPGAADAESPTPLPLGLRDLQIDFAGIHLSDPDAVRYRVQLVGYDAEPQQIGSRRSAFYTNLPPGDYRFEVAALLGDRDAALPPATLAFRLPPTLVETRWFQALLLLTGVAAAFGLFRWRVLRLEQLRRSLAEQVRQRTAELEAANRKLLETSVTDPLTGLRNRRYLVSEIPQDIAQVERTYTTGKKDANRDLLFLMIDLDHFKQINDRHGHHTGDQVLVQFAEILERLVRECDYIIRWGGEEFLVIGRQADRAHSTALAERIVTAVREHVFETDQGALRCSCSVGVAVYPPLPGRPGALGWEETIELADAATYLAKQEGRDRWTEIRLPSGELPLNFMERFRAAPLALAASGEIEIDRERAPAGPPAASGIAAAADAQIG